MSPTETRAYRERLYQHYRDLGGPPDVEQARRELASRAPYLRGLARLVMSEPRSARVLDVGCGYGAFLLALREAGFASVEGIDASAQQVELAKRLGLDCVRQDDALDALRGAPDGSWDVIAALDLLEHLTKDEALAFVDEAHRVLSPGGRLLLHVPNGEAIFAGAVYFGDLTHEIAFTRRSLRQLLGAAGFTRLSVFEDAPVVHGLSSALRYVLWRVVRSAFRVIYVAETGDTSRDLVLSQNLLAIADKH
jgi:2-polyprenyl-3-methyl-5-hydroxy-6-metoxy-1,4-benzoquinol methylase